MTATTRPREASAFTKFRLLMWKNFLHQWRRRIQTLVELLLPVAAMSLVLILRGQLEPAPRDTERYRPIMAHDLGYSTNLLFTLLADQRTEENATLEFSLAYSPASPELKDVVESAFAKLILKNYEVLYLLLQVILDFPDWPLPPDLDIDSSVLYEIVKRLVVVREYNSSSEMSGLYTEGINIPKVLAAFEFDDALLGATELPRDITYALRFPERPRMTSYMSGGNYGSSSWRTNLVFPAFERPGPRVPWDHLGGRDPGYMHEMFIALQHSVSSEIVYRLTGHDLSNANITMQRYPHPPYLEDLASELLEYLFPAFITFAFSYTAINIVRAVTMEKELQLKEIMKIMGLPTWLHWTAWFCKQFLYLTIASFLIVLLIKVEWFTTTYHGQISYAVFTATPWTVLLFFMIVYMISTICFCFMLSGLFSSSSSAALFTGVIWFVSGVPAALIALEREVSVGLQTFTCLSINSAMTYGFQLIMAQEGTGGVQWGSFFASPSTEFTRFTFGHVIVMLLADAVIYMLLALYLEQVLPGPFGTPKRWYFLFTKNFWCSNKNKVSDETYVVNNNPDDSDILKEPDPVGLAVGVNINDLSKAYGNNLVVNCLSMNIYDDQITVLLGHNGAGKSTTISMLTGNVAPTSGSVIVAGYDLASQHASARSNLGLCAQNNVLFNELTVKEHLEFFGRLKGFEGEELSDEINSLIVKLGLEEKRDYPSHGLSGGQKRRLCVGIALCGKAKVVLLDEPTSGMDPASRRHLWDLLQKEKKGRSMILTTHFMDEADFLGDRIAIMAQGRLQCVGSPQFLKRNHGLSYQLVVVKDNGFDYEKCSDLIKNYIPDFITKDERGTEVTFSLSNDHAHLFETMLEDLENNVATIKFKNYGLVSTTLEDVFMSLGADMSLLDSNSDDGNTTNASDTGSMDQLHTEVKKDVTGFKLIVQHFLAMWLKLWLYWSRSWGIVIMQITVPVILINMTLLVGRLMSNASDNVVPRHLSLSVGFTQTESLVTYNGTSSDTIFAQAKPAYEAMFANAGIPSMKATAVEDQDIADYYLERAQATPGAIAGLRHTMLIGATFLEDSAIGWFSNFGYHDIAISLAAVHNAFLKAVDSTANLQVYNHPLPATYEDRSNTQSVALVMSLQLSNGIGTSIGIVSAVFILFYIKERASGAKLLQKAAGLQPATMWSSAAVFDWLWFIIVGLTVLASCAAFQVPGLSSAAELGRLYLCIMIYGAAMLPMIYLFTFLFKRPAIGFVVVFFLNALFGMMSAQVVAALMVFGPATNDTAYGLDMTLQFFPMYSFVTAVRKMNELELIVLSCMNACEAASVWPGAPECTMEALCQFEETCCVDSSSTFNWAEPGILRYLIVMLASGVFFWALLMVIEYRLVRRLFIWKKTPPDQRSLDEDVSAEEYHVSRIDPASLAQHGLVAKGLSKYYGKNLAVDQISFSVSDAECFGLLGVNGAGKTTTFKMLMGDETISSGQAFINGYSVEKQSTKVYENIGYCPQFDALFPELTGRETLRFFSLLRGQRPDNISMQAAALADSLGFLVHLDKRVSEYSGGTKRKLNTAVAFLGNTRLVFVDEPTTGVDPAAKRHVWRAVRSVQKSGRGVVLTSHSMEECEALCSRLTIMVNGRFQCLGTPQHLKNKFSQGYMLIVKVSIAYALTAGYNQATGAVKEFVITNFRDAKLMEEHQGVLTFYLPDLNMPWSKMFGTMERAKRDLSVEYYNITQTTLEQIFLQFAQYQTNRA